MPTEDDPHIDIRGDGYELAGGPQTGEIATVMSRWDSIFGEINPDDVVQKVGLRIYEKMLTNPTVKGGSRLKALGVVGPGWEVAPAQTGERAAEEMAEFVDWNFQVLRGPFKNVELGVLTGMDYGFSLSELKWGIVSDGPWAGKWALMDIKTKPPFPYGFKRDEYGNLLAITHQSWSGKIDEFTNLKKWIIYSHDVGSVFGSPYGRSQLRSAYDYWKALQLLFRMRGVFVERTASGIPLIRYKRGLRRSETARYEKMVRKLQTAAGMAVPEDIIVEWAEKKGDSHEEFEKFAIYCERAILRALLVPSQIGIGPETTVGSMAKARVHQSIFEWVMGDADSDLTAAINEQVVQRICDNNFPNAAEIGYPIWRHKERSSDDAVKLVAGYVKAIEGRGLGPVTLDDINTARRRLGMSELTEKEWLEYQEAENQKAAETADTNRLENGPDDGEDEVEEPGNGKTTVSIPKDTPGEDEKVAEFAAPDPIMLARQQPFVRETLYRATVAGVHANPKLYRELTAVEKAQGLNPRAMSKIIDGLEVAASKEIVGAFDRVRGKLVDKLDRRGLLDGTAKEAELWKFGGLDAQGKKTLSDTMHRTLLSGYIHGALAAKGELEKGVGRKFEFALFDGVPVHEFAELRPEFLIEPNEAKEYWSKLIPLSSDVAQSYKAEAFWIADVYLSDNGEVLRAAKEAIRQGYKTGNWGACEARINALFDEWLGTGRMTPAGALYEPWHTHVIVRNASMRGYNAGRAELFRQAKDWIEAYQWASIIDERTSDFCDFMDGVIFSPGQVEFPPAHHQCRSIVMAVLRGMSYELADQETLARGAGMRDASFTSGVMGIL
ncbi:MAG: DUF935 family protein [Methanophagales archaeon]|nr:DUF935 family protein [Methanophagales archaeon]